MKNRTDARAGVFLPFSVIGLLFTTGHLFAQTNGTWNFDGSGNWSDTLNWSGGDVASGATATADFSTINITGDHVINVDGPYTIGSLLSDDLTTLSNSWTFSGTGPLTLDNGASQPVLNIFNRTPTISVPLVGTNGFTKTGAGALTLTGDNSGLSGTIDLADVTGTNNAGLILASDTAIGGVDTILINGSGSSGQYLALDGGVTLGSGVAITLDTQGGNNAPLGGIRSTGTNSDVNTIEGPITITRSGSRISNVSAQRLDITGAITADPGVTSFAFRRGVNEGVYITNPANSWSGNTVHSQEILWFEPGALPDTTSLQIAASGAGTIQTNGSFTRALGNGAGEAFFTLSAGRAMGFGARGGDLTLDFGGAGAEVLFDTTATAPVSTIRSNILVLNNGTADSKLTLINPLNLNEADRTIQTNTNVTELVGGVTGNGGLTKIGNGTLQFSTASTYTGTTTINGGTVQTTGGDDRLPTGTTLAFTGTTGDLDLTSNSQTLADMTVPNSLGASYTLSGDSLTLNGAADRQFGPGGAVTTAHSVTVDMVGLTSFTSTAPANVFRVGIKASSPNPSNTGTLGNVATVILADQNEITANSLRIGDQSASNNGGISTLRLGSMNTFNVNSINIGASGRSNSNFLFDSGLTSPSVVIRNTDGSSAVNDWRVGQVANFTASTWTDIVDFSGGEVDALVNALTIGTADIGNSTGRGGTENASFTMGEGTLEASTLLLGRISTTNTPENTTNATITSTMAANGTFTLDHPAGLVKAETITLAENTTLAGGTGSRRVSGTFNLTDGTLEASTIQLGTQTGNATATAAFNWSNGTIRSLTPGGLAFNSVPLNLLSGSHTFDANDGSSITVDAASSVSGDGGLTKIGTGTVSLGGLNDYTGPTDVQVGTLAISNTFPSGSSLTVAPTATLSLADVTLGSPLDIDGSLVLTGPVRLAAPVDSPIPGSFPAMLQYGSITGGGNLEHPYRNGSITAGATSTDLTVSAGIPLTWTGAISNDWDLNSSANWKDGSDNPETFYWADSVIFDSAGSGFPNVNLTEELRPAAVTVNEDTVDYVFTGSGFISGSTGITKDGLAKLTISTENTNTGITTINAGTLEVGDGGTNGALGSGNIVNNGELVFNRSDNATLENEISGTGSATKLGAGVLTVISDNSYAGGTTISAGTIQVGTQSNPTGSLGTGEVINDGTLRLNQADGTNPHAYTFANDISGTGGLIIGQGGAGAAFDSVVTLTGNNSFTGEINVSSGGLTILDVAALGTGPKNIILTNGTNGRPQLYLDGSAGDITLPADFSFRTSSPFVNQPAIGNVAGDNVIAGDFTLLSGGGNTAISVFGGSLTLNGNLAAGTSSRNLNLAGTLGAPGTINGVISDGTHPMGLVMSGPNTWTLNGDNSYTGATTINNGTLVINGDQSLATGKVTVTSSSTLSGIGTIGGEIDARADSTVAPGTSIGTLSAAGDATLAGSFEVEVDGATSDLLAVTGALNIDAATLVVNPLAAPGETVYIIASYGTLTGTGTFASVPAGYAVDYNYLGGNQIALTSTGASIYDSWASSNGLTGGNALSTADVENMGAGDGLVNILEFGFGTDPNLVDNGPLAIDGSVNGVPIVQVIGSGEGASFNFVFVRRDDFGTSGSANYTVQFSSDLSTFYDSSETPTFVADSSADSDYEVVSVPYPALLPNNQKARFARVRVELAP